jgi:uncharacterized phage protein (TIGR02218 family)
MAEADYLAHLATGTTTRAHCWKVTRTDGAVLGFTNHDEPIAFGGVTYEARSAFAGSEVSGSLGLAVDDQDITGALSSAAITAADLARGLFDGARVELYDVNWSDPAARQLQGAFLVGEVERGELAFRAEMRAAIAPLEQKVGARFVPECAATVGDGRCGVALGDPAFTGEGTVFALGAQAFTASGLGGFASGWFDRGVVTWATGANAGTRSEVRAFRGAGGRRSLALWRATPAPVAVGDSFTVSAGCDKTLATCSAKFANVVNFRGFPHMPGEGFAAEYAVLRDPTLDGGARIRGS